VLLLRTLAASCGANAQRAFFQKAHGKANHRRVTACKKHRFFMEALSAGMEAVTRSRPALRWARIDRFKLVK